MSLNQMQIIGNVGSAPEVKTLDSGKTVTTFSVAVNEKRKDQDHTEWFKIVTWDKLAEVCGQYLDKGKQVYVSGRLQTRSYDDKDGNKKYITEVVANTVQFLGSKSDTMPESEVHPGVKNHAPQLAKDDSLPF